MFDIVIPAIQKYFVSYGVKRRMNTKAHLVVFYDLMCAESPDTMKDMKRHLDSTRVQLNRELRHHPDKVIEKAVNRVNNLLFAVNGLLSREIQP